jgi:hypothetical protein
MPPLDDYTCAHFLQPSRQLLIFHPHPAVRTTPSTPTSASSASVPLYLPSSAPGAPVEAMTPTSVGAFGATSPATNRGSGSTPGTPTGASAAVAAGGPASNGVPVLEECLYMMDANPRSPSLGTCRLVPTGGQKPDARIRVATALVPTSMYYCRVTLHIAVCLIDGIHGVYIGESKVEIFTYGGCKDNKELSGGLRCLNLTLTPASPAKQRVEAPKSSPGTPVNSTPPSPTSQLHVSTTSTSMSSTPPSPTSTPGTPLTPG